MSCGFWDLFQTFPRFLSGVYHLSNFPPDYYLVKTCLPDFKLRRKNFSGPDFRADFRTDRGGQVITWLKPCVKPVLQVRLGKSCPKAVRQVSPRVFSWRDAMLSFCNQFDGLGDVPSFFSRRGDVPSFWKGFLPYGFPLQKEGTSLG